MNTNAVNVSIGADSSAFMRGMEQVKAIAKASTAQIAASIASTKIPAPDLAPVIARQKAIAASNAALLTDTKQTVSKLKVLLDEQAAAYQAANKFQHPIPGRSQLSGSRMPGPPNRGGQWDHLSGTQFEGGTRGPGGKAGGSGWGRNGYAAGVAYNAVQDGVQDGLPALANNVPQIIDLVSSSPALKMLGAAAFAAAATFFAVKFGKDLYDNTGDRADEKAGNRYDQNRRAARARTRDREFAEGKTAAAASGERAGDAGVAAGSASASAEATANRRGDVDQMVKAQADESRRLKINAIEDPAARARAAAEEDKRLINEKYERDRKSAEDRLKWAGEEWDAASRRVSQIQAELKLLEGISLTREQIIEKTRLEAELPGAKARRENARARADGAFGARDDAAYAEKNLRAGDLTAVDEKRDAELAEIQKQATADRIEGEAAYQREYMRYLEMRKTAEKELAEKQAANAKQKAALEEQLEISEAQAGGGSRKGKKMERARDLRESTDKFKAAGFSDAEAAAMAKREQRAADRSANPRRIRGAGADGPAPERASALDYLDGKPMAGPKTSKLDEYEKRRSIPGVGGQVDKGLAEREAAEAKKAAENTGVSEMVKAFPQIPVLLKAILNALTGQPAAPDAATG